MCGELDEVKVWTLSECVPLLPKSVFKPKSLIWPSWSRLEWTPRLGWERLFFSFCSRCVGELISCWQWLGCTKSLSSHGTQVRKNCTNWVTDQKPAPLGTGWAAEDLMVCQSPTHPERTQCSVLGLVSLQSSWQCQGGSEPFLQPRVLTRVQGVQPLWLYGRRDVSRGSLDWVYHSQITSM